MWSATVALAVLLLGAQSCANPSSGEPAGPASGWRPVTIPMSATDTANGGVGEVRIQGDWILVMAGYGNLYLGRVGSREWRRVPSPEDEPIARIEAADSVFLCGGVSSGRVFTLDPRTLRWTDLGFPRGDSMRVFSIVRWRGRWIAFLSKMGDSARHVVSFDLAGGPLLRLENGWPLPNSASTTFAMDTLLLAGTFEAGTYRLGATDLVWRKVPSPIWHSTAFGEMEVRFPRALAYAGGRFWSGYLVDGLHSAPRLDSPWVRVDADSLRGYMPKDVFVLLPWRGKLFVAGKTPSIPLVHDPAQGTWKHIPGNFCQDERGAHEICLYRTTWEMATSGDTLYAAAGGMLLKIGWADIP